MIHFYRSLMIFMQINRCRSSNFSVDKTKTSLKVDEQGVKTNETDWSFVWTTGGKTYGDIKICLVLEFMWKEKLSLKIGAERYLTILLKHKLSPSGYWGGSYISGVVLILTTITLLIFASPKVRRGGHFAVIVSSFNLSLFLFIYLLLNSFTQFIFSYFCCSHIQLRFITGILFHIQLRFITGILFHIQLRFITGILFHIQLRFITGILLGTSYKLHNASNWHYCALHEPLEVDVCTVGYIFSGENSRNENYQKGALRDILYNRL